jgi:hypothetical protein
MEYEIMRELTIIAGVNVSIYLAASAYIENKISGKNKKKRKGFLE